MRLCAGDLGPVDVCARASPGLTRSTGPTASRPVTMRRRHRFTRDLLSRGRPLVPFFGSPAVRIDSLTRGFASPPRGGFALLVKGASYQNNTGARRSPIASQARHRKDDGSAPGPLADASGVARMTKRRRASDLTRAPLRVRSVGVRSHRPDDERAELRFSRSGKPSIRIKRGRPTRLGDRPTGPRLQSNTRVVARLFSGGFRDPAGQNGQRGVETDPNDRAMPVLGAAVLAPSRATARLDLPAALRRDECEDVWPLDLERLNYRVQCVQRQSNLHGRCWPTCSTPSSAWRRRDDARRGVRQEEHRRAAQGRRLLSRLAGTRTCRRGEQAPRGPR